MRRHESKVRLRQTLRLTTEYRYGELVPQDVQHEVNWRKVGGTHSVVISLTLQHLLIKTLHLVLNAVAGLCVREAILSLRFLIAGVVKWAIPTT